MIGIIGAGISGLVAARALKRRGHAVWVLDKGRGVGGRVATRRAAGEAEGAIFDHGAQFFTCRTPEFQNLLDEMLQAGAAAEWFRGYPSDKPNGNPDGHPRFRGAPGMSALAKFLAQELDVKLDEPVTRIAAAPGGWQVHTREHLLAAQALILTPPVPQSLALLDAGPVILPHSAREALEKVSYEPCWAVLAQLAGASHLPPPGALHLENGPIAWLADNYQKGISPRPGAVTLHARGNWSRVHLEDSPEAVAARLLELAARHLGEPVVAWQARRWRYAKPENTHPAPLLQVHAPAPLIFAGDAFTAPGTNPRLEAAVLSGLAAAACL